MIITKCNIEYVILLFTREEGQSLTPQQNSGGMAYPSYPPIPLPLPPQNPYPCEGVRVLEGKGKGRDSLPQGYPCHSLLTVGTVLMTWLMKQLMIRPQASGSI